jgi:hypothetical protein
MIPARSISTAPIEEGIPLARTGTGPIRTNRDRLIEQAAIGRITPAVSSAEWLVSPDGTPSILPGTGSITYNCKVGDSAIHWEADHIEPGVSVKGDRGRAGARLVLLACVGNAARVVSGDAKGDEGVVTGVHGVINHVLVDVPDATLDKLAIGDKVQVRSCGLGLRLTDMPNIALMNLDPRLLEKMAPEPDGDRLRVKVARIVPAAVMGSGLNHSHAFAGDCDVQLSDPEIVQRYGLEDLRLGDIVALENADHTFGRVHRTGAVSIGVIIHGRCTVAGHGPGVTSLMSSAEGKIVPVLDPSANIADYLKIGRKRPAARAKRT